MYNTHSFVNRAHALFLTLLFAPLLTAELSAQELSIPCDELEEKVLAESEKDKVTRITGFTPAKPLERVSPKYPSQAVMRGREGWVKLSYVIDEEGRVKDPVIDDFFGHKAFKRSALSAVKKWKFEPAIKDGQPTQQCHQSVQMDFAIANQTGASRKFIKAYKDVDALFQAGDIDAADKALSELKEWDTLNRYENTWLLNMDWQIARSLENVERETRSLTRVLASNGSKSNGNMVFDEDYVAYALQRKTMLDSQRGLYADALSSFDSLSKMESQQARISQIAPLVERIKSVIESEQNLTVPVTIGKQGSWFHTLVRNQFAFNNVEGELDTVEVRCDTHREKFTVAENHIWRIPPSWGQCRVLVEGDSTTTFDLIEVAQS
tara:strand:+ start:1595 stop:2731 length:1137 start_codon:yes stop_codon:yes gene_type:complete